VEGRYISCLSFELEIDVNSKASKLHCQEKIGVSWKHWLPRAQAPNLPPEMDGTTFLSLSSTNHQPQKRQRHCSQFAAQEPEIAH
jgi:hypothetical protein